MTEEQDGVGSGQSQVAIGVRSRGIPDVCWGWNQQFHGSLDVEERMDGVTSDS